MFSGKKWMWLTLVVAALAIGGCEDDDDGQAQADLFLAILTGANEIPPVAPAVLTLSLLGSNEVPPVTTSSTGTVTLTPGANSLAYVITLSGATAVTMAHIHEGGAGETGDPIVTLFNGPTTGTVNGELVSGTITTLPSGYSTWAEFFEDLRAGELYVNVHTTANPNGQLRAQSGASGRADVEIQDDHIDYELRVFGAIGVTGAHFHFGDATVSNGPIRATLYTNATGSGLVNGLLASGEIDAGDITGMTFQQLVDAIRDGEIYVNVHTLAYPDGAMRGQLEENE